MVFPQGCEVCDIWTVDEVFSQRSAAVTDPEVASGGLRGESLMIYSPPNGWVVVRICMANGFVTDNTERLQRKILAYYLYICYDKAIGNKHTASLQCLGKGTQLPWQKIMLALHRAYITMRNFE